MAVRAYRAWAVISCVLKGGSQKIKGLLLPNLPAMLIAAPPMQLCPKLLVPA